MLFKLDEFFIFVKMGYVHDIRIYDNLYLQLSPNGGTINNMPVNNAPVVPDTPIKKPTFLPSSKLAPAFPDTYIQDSTPKSTKAFNDTNFNKVLLSSSKSAASPVIDFKVLYKADTSIKLNLDSNYLKKH